ncbi:MAG: hypothetical protein H0W50_06995, partial [Parachlamydiaceae bacterium]|nr:hypothetical protein [Parachlamydiaceae bacterium]
LIRKLLWKRNRITYRGEIRRISDTPASDSWETYKKGEVEIQKEITGKFLYIYQKISSAIKGLEVKIKKDKKIDRKKQILIEKLLSSLIEYPNKFQHLFDSVLLAPIRVSSNIMQEMRLYFWVLDGWNKKAEAFHKSLYSSSIPCTFFNPLDLLILQIFRCQDKIRQSEFLCMDSLLENLIVLVQSMIESLQQSVTTSVITESLPNFQSANCVKNFCQKLIELMELLNEGFTTNVFEQISKIPEVAELKNTVFLFIQYLDALPTSLKQSYRHFVTTVMDPLSSRIEIFFEDISLIKYHMHVIAISTKEKNLSNNFVGLEKQISERLKQAPAEGTFFWRLSLKYVILSKLVFIQMQNLFEECDQKLKVCSSHNQVLQVLNKCVGRFERANKTRNAWGSQLTIIGNLAIKEENVEAIELVRPISTAILWIDFFYLTIQEIVNLNPILVQKTSLKNVNRSNKSAGGFIDFPSSEESAEKIEEIPLENTSSYLEESREIVDYERHLNQLHILKSQTPNLLNSQESLESFTARFLKREEIIQNSSFYLDLIEEGKVWDKVEESTSKPLILRAQLDHALLLEATQKLALISLRIGTREAPNHHIISSDYNGRPLGFTHDGVQLTNLLHSVGMSWFNDSNIQPLILNQELLLKKISWFQKDQGFVEGISSVITVCENVWNDLDKSCNFSSQHNLYRKALNYHECCVQIHHFKRSHLSTSILFSSVQDAEATKSSIKNLITTLEISPECEEISKSHKHTINRILDFHEVLTVYQQKELIPLFFAVRSAEIQVGILSQALILALSTIRTVKGQSHPLFITQKGRSLNYSHQVDKLWKVLKEEAGAKIDFDTIQRLDSQVSQFIGDPRYPHPNKTILTNQLINMQEKCYLLRKIKSERWFGSEDKKLLAKHVGRDWMGQSVSKLTEILERAIAKKIAEQNQKSCLAFELAEIILKLDLG